MNCDVSCSQQNQAQVLAGSAPSQKRQWFIEIPQPWPRQVLASSYLHAQVLLALQHAVRSKISVYGFCGEKTRVGAKKIRLIDAWSEGNGEGKHQHYEISAQESVEWFQSLLHNPEGVASYRKDQVGRDVFICTHGQRDQCCGVLGEEVYVKYSHLASNDLRIWKVSHLGGHRFAPTWLELPEKLWWGRSDFDAVVTRTGQPWKSLRGRSMLSPRAQILERMMLEQYGWPWLDVAKNASYQESGNDIEVTAPGLKAYAEILCLESFQPVSCGQAAKSVKEYEIVECQIGSFEV
ncbi:MAG: sucrase ferredoxin [Oligoflexales bacterium]